MFTKRYKSEQIVTVLRQIEVEIANGKTIPQADIGNSGQILTKGMFPGTDRLSEPGTPRASTPE